MRVRFTQDYSAYLPDQYRIHAFKAGDEFDEPFSQQLVSLGCPVVDVEEKMGDVDGDGVPDGGITEVIEWVGPDPAKAVLALEAENKREKPRSTLVAALEKIAASGAE